MIIPVISLDRKPLMPTTPSRARRWVKSGKATWFWHKGVYCVRLNVKSGEELQIIALGIDPGSKREGFTAKSTAKTIINIQTEAVTGVGNNMEIRKTARRNRRNRKTPYRKQRLNRKRGGGLPPSIKSSWQWKLRILIWLKSILPITHVIVEDIKAETKGQPKWDKSFSPLQVGKNWFYDEICKLGVELTLKQGYETAELRNSLGLKKNNNKLSKSFSTHCVDSWVMANSIVGGHTKPDNEEVLYIKPLQFHRRQLHVFCPTKGGNRKNYGGTMSMGLKRGSLILHKKHGLCYVGGTSKNRITLHNMHGERITRSVRPEDCKFLCYNSWVIN